MQKGSKMQTVRLFDTDQYTDSFEAKVLLCEKTDTGYKILLDKTAFFPEAGGQPCDTGVLDDIPVSFVKEENGKIYHYVEKPLCEGSTVKGKIDFDRRFCFMQNHSGEHIVSGIVHRKYGFNNVGFHLNEKFVTLDFDGILSREQLDEIEDEANKAVFENHPIRAYYPSKEEAKTVSYRSKKEVEGALRLVEIEGVDICACCAPHVSSTGEIGIIKLLDISRMRGGIRIVLKCGKYALSDYRNKYKNISNISDMLSAKQEESADAVHNLLSKYDDIKRDLSEQNRRMIEGLVKSSAPSQRFFFVKNFEMKELQIFSDSLHKTHGGIKAVFSGESGNYNFAICGEEEETEKILSAFRAAFSVRGGGRNGMVQGTVKADINAVKDFFEKEE